MAMYTIPDEFYFRLHHPRPRFKSNIENVLIYIATEIVQIGSKPKERFKEDLNAAIKMFPGNFESTKKTIDNWRTEIDALFALIQEKGNNLEPTYRAIDLAENQDLVKFFKVFCYYFQYPGGFVKNHFNFEILEAKINFKPAQYILNMLYEAEQVHGIRAGLSKPETTHCIFNDLRVTRDNQKTSDTWNRITQNRVNNHDYDLNGDIIRYAGDILDYLVQANLLVRRPNGKYYLNRAEAMAIQRFIQPTEHEFNYYEILQKSFEDIEKLDIAEVDKRKLKFSKISNLEHQWITYFNTPLTDEFFDTDVISLVTSDITDEAIDISVIISEISNYTTGNIGSVGETLTVNHEIKRLKLNGREDLAHLVKFIPTHHAMGYDVNSRELDGGTRNIEVKTTASSSEIQFTRFHLTPNEWAVAESNQDRYYVYRLMISKESIKLYILQNPVKLYKTDRLRALPRNGMDIIFDPKTTGLEEKLLL